MQSIRALPGKWATLAFPRLFPVPVKIARKAKSHGSRRPQLHGRKILKIERPTWRDKFCRGEAPIRPALIGLVAFYVLIGFTGLILGDAMQSFKDGTRQVVAISARGFGFGIREIRVEGGTRLSDAEITRIINITPASSAFTFNVAETRQRFLDIPWIKSASVRLTLPGTLQVNVEEREPYALWQRNGVVTMLDRDGRRIGPYNDARFSALPLIVGNGADEQAAKLLQELERYPALQSRMRAAILVAKRRWNIKLTEGTDIKLPEQDFAAALAKLSELDKNNALLNRDITVVDLRYPDRVIVRLTEGAAKSRDESLKIKPSEVRRVIPVVGPKTAGGRA